MQPAAYPTTAPTDRHPLDPEPVPETKAGAVLALGLVAVLTGPFLGGVIPAVLALLLARQARRDMVAAAGFLTGGRRLRAGVRLAQIGLGLAVTALVVAVIFGLLEYASLDGGRNYDPNVN